MVNRDPTTDYELANKKFVDVLLGGFNFSRFNQSKENILIVSVQKDLYNLSKNDKNQNIETTIINSTNSGGHFFQNCVIKCNDKYNKNKIQNFTNSTKSNSPSSKSGAESLSSIGNSFVYIETISNNQYKIAFCQLEKDR